MFGNYGCRGIQIGRSDLKKNKKKKKKKLYLYSSSLSRPDPYLNVFRQFKEELKFFLESAVF